MAFRTPSDALSDVYLASKRRDKLSQDRAVQRVHRSIPISGDPRPLGTKRMAAYAIGCAPAVVVTAITACTLSSGTYTPGTGAVQLYYMDDDATVASADVDNASVTVYNWYQNSGTVAVGKSVWVASWSGVYWFVDSDC